MLYLVVTDNLRMNMRTVNAPKLERGNFGSNLVTQHNDLITASYDLTVTEKKLLLGCISKINSFENITSETPFSFDVMEAGEILGVDLANSGAVARFRAAARELMTKIVSHDTEQGWIDSTFAQTASFDANTKIMTIYFSKGIIPYLSNLHTKFTTYRLLHVGNLSSKYSIRLYELLVMWNGKNYGKPNLKKFTIEEFEDILCCGKSYRSEFYMFKKRVVDPACEQVNAETDVKLDIEFKKTGKRYTHVELSFLLKEDWRQAEKDFKKLLSDEQIRTIINNPEFYNKYKHLKVYAGLSVSEFLAEAKRLLEDAPKKHFKDYADYLKGK